MGCGYNYDYRYGTTYSCTDGYNYSNGQCCNLAEYRFWNTMIWMSIFCLCCMLCSIMSARARRRRMEMM